MWFWLTPIVVGGNDSKDYQFIIKLTQSIISWKGTDPPFFIIPLLVQLSFGNLLLECELSIRNHWWASF
jgi:hypothetical protein